MPRRRPDPDTSGKRGRGAAPLDPRSLSTRLIGPEWARVEGFEVRQSLNDEKRYRCPYCEQWIPPGVRHIVAFPEGRPDDRRHYHTPCWERQTGRRRPDPV